MAMLVQALAQPRQPAQGEDCLAVARSSPALEPLCLAKQEGVSRICLFTLLSFVFLMFVDCQHYTTLASLLFSAVPLNELFHFSQKLCMWACHG